jgi:hypothetical protein
MFKAYKLYGGNLINLVLAEQILKLGKKVIWHTLGEKVGGHFSGMLIEGSHIDLGMVLLEFGAESIQALETSKDPATASALLEFFKEFPIDSAIVLCRHQSQYFPDFIISDECDLIWRNNYRSTYALENPKRKWDEDLFEIMTYENYCLTSYPKFYNELLKNFADKITFNGADKISSRYHRNAWLPLYYPDTISGNSRMIPPYPFHRIKDGTIASVIHSKFLKITQNSNCTIIDSAAASLDELITSKNETPLNFISCNVNKLAPNATEILKYFMHQTKINIAIYSYNKKNISNIACINDLDHPNIYRVSFQADSLSKQNFVVIESAAFIEDISQWQSNVENYLKTELRLTDISAKFIKTSINGPSLPIQGAENALNKIKNEIHAKFDSKSIFTYGLHDGLQALSLNKQLSQAFEKIKLFL